MKYNYRKKKGDQLISFAEYCFNRMKKIYDFTWRITPDGNSCFVSKDTGEQFTKSELDAIYPTPSILFFSQNAEKKYNFLNNQKSY